MKKKALVDIVVIDHEYVKWIRYLCVYFALTYCDKCDSVHFVKENHLCFHRNDLGLGPAPLYIIVSQGFYPLFQVPVITHLCVES